MQELEALLLKYLKMLDVEVKFDLKLKPYAKTLFGRYNPNDNSITLYVFRDKDLTNTFTVEELLKTLLHEVVHCVQWNDRNFTRYKGVMHNTEFWLMYQKYLNQVDSVLSSTEKELYFINEKALAG